MSYGIGGIVAQVEVAGKRRCLVAYHSHRVQSRCWVKNSKSESLSVRRFYSGLTRLSFASGQEAPELKREAKC